MDQDSVPVRGPGRPSARDESLPSEDDILSRGLATFAELGYDATSVRELARRLGVSHNFIGDRYGSKQEFWRAVVDNAQVGLGGRLSEILAADYDDELDRFRDGIRAFHQGIAINPDLARIIDHESTEDTERFHYVYERHFEPVVVGLKPGLESLVAEGRVQPFPLDVVLFSAIAMSKAVNISPMLRRLGTTFDESPERFFGMLSSIVLDGLIVHEA